MSGIIQSMVASFGKAPLAFVGGTTGTSVADSSPTFSLTGLTGGIESSPKIGDLVIACIEFDDTTDRLLTCSGYTKVADLFENGLSRFNFGVFYKVLTAEDTDVTFGISVSKSSIFVCHVWRNENSSPLDATSQTDTDNDGTPDPVSITTVTNNAVVLAIGCANNTQNNSLSNLTVPSGMTNFFGVGDSANQLAIASIARETAGAYDPPAFGGGGSSGVNGVVTMAIRPS